MRAFASLVALFALLAACLPLLEAQDPKTDPKTEEKKDEKKAETKKIVRVDETIVMASPRALVKIREIKADPKEVVIVAIDPQKNVEFTDWDNKAVGGFRSNPASATNAALLLYRQDKAKRFDDIFSGEVRTIPVSDAMRIRTPQPPPQFDAAGNVKKINQSDLPRLKGSFRLPGYTGDFAALREGQLVEIYMVKQAAPTPKKIAIEPKKGFIGADPTLNIVVDGGKLDVHMIAIQTTN